MSLVAAGVLLILAGGVAAFLLARRPSAADRSFAVLVCAGCVLAGLPGISVPCGLTSEGLPVGAQLLGKPLDEATLLRVGGVIEEAVGLGEKRPNL